MRELRERVDPTSLVAGIAVVLLGLLIMLQEEGSIDLESGWLLAGIAAASGIALVASGIGTRRG